MNTANVPTALELEYRRDKLALLKSQLNQPYVRIGVFNLNGTEINSTVVNLEKNTALPSPDPYQTLAADFITDVQTQLDADIVSINADIAALTC